MIVNISCSLQNKVLTKQESAGAEVRVTVIFTLLQKSLRVKAYARVLKVLDLSHLSRASYLANSCSLTRLETIKF